ncbi:MAG: endonuclease V-domain-containing protein [Monoraphidium minutum]|nr:MAG: endonuclease V-domain-containing protein [Monoraphidium minutum]
MEEITDAQRESWEREQLQLAARVVQEDAPGLDDLRLVGGLDMSFFAEPGATPSAGTGAGAACRGDAAAGLGAPHASGAPAGAALLAAAEPHAAGGGGGSGGGGGFGRAVAALAVLALPGLELTHLELLETPLAVPYLPGLLGFREVPSYLELLERAAAKGVRPQLLMVDGFGVLHPRRCGSASHLGVLSGLPTVGVAKNLLHVEGLLQKQVRAAAAAAAGAASAARPVSAEPGGAQPTEVPGAGASGGAGGGGGGGGSGGGGGGGAWLPLVGSSGEVLGAAVCAAAGSSRPVYVSAGHRVSLNTAVRVVTRCCRHRVPEPIRQADLLSREEVRRLAAPQACGPTAHGG